MENTYNGPTPSCYRRQAWGKIILIPSCTCLKPRHNLESPGASWFQTSQAAMVKPGPGLRSRAGCDLSGGNRGGAWSSNRGRQHHAAWGTHRGGPRAGRSTSWRRPAWEAPVPCRTGNSARSNCPPESPRNPGSWQGHSPGGRESGCIADPMHGGGRPWPFTN